MRQRWGGREPWCGKCVLRGHGSTHDSPQGSQDASIQLLLAWVNKLLILLGLNPTPVFLQPGPLLASSPVPSWWVPHCVPSFVCSHSQGACCHLTGASSLYFYFSLCLCLRDGCLQAFILLAIVLKFPSLP